MECKYINYPHIVISDKLTERELLERIPSDLTNDNICLFSQKRQQKLRTTVIQENSKNMKK